MSKVLVITDYQNDFVSPHGKVAERIGGETIANLSDLRGSLQSLIDYWHSHSWPIVFVVSDYDTANYKGDYKEHRARGPYGDTAIPGTEGYQLYSLVSSDKDIFVEKRFFDGFYETSLQEKLKSLDSDEVYFAGVNTDVCVFHTAIGAVIRGYSVYIIEDATDTVTNHKQIFLDYLKNYTGIKIINSSEVKA